MISNSIRKDERTYCVDKKMEPTSQGSNKKMVDNMKQSEKKSVANMKQSEDG
jgi:hypothetical protein